MIRGTVYVDRVPLAEGATNPITQKFEQVKTRLLSQVEEAVTRNAIEVTATVKRKLSGEVLGNVTGTLRRSINYQVIKEPGLILAIVGANMDRAKYAAAWEYGFDGVVTVREHLRNQVTAFGRQINPRLVTVRGHQRHMRMQERSFLRSSLREHRDRIIESIQAAGVSAIVAG